LLLYSSHLPLGVPNGLVIYHASWPHGLRNWLLCFLDICSAELCDRFSCINSTLGVYIMSNMTLMFIDAFAHDQETLIIRWHMSWRFSQHRKQKFPYDDEQEQPRSDLRDAKQRMWEIRSTYPYRSHSGNV
jgi:hypothetical protein